MKSSPIDKILGLVRPLPANGNAAEPAGPLAEGGIVSALAQLASERNAAQAAIDAALERRADLLLRPGSDAAIAKLDSDADTAALVVERLDLAEPLLIAMLRDRQDADRRAIFDDLREMYARAVHLFADSARKAHRHRALLIAIRSSAEQMGFQQEAPTLMPLPTPNVLASAASVTNFESSFL